MEFGRVYGRAWFDEECQGDSIRIKVMLETRSATRTVRDECVALLQHGDSVTTLAWNADQLTQETIGVDLGNEGWEAVSLAVANKDLGAVDLATVTYVVRRL